MENIRSRIRSLRPNVSDKTVITYASLLFNLWKQSPSKGEEISPEWFREHVDEVMHILSSKTPQSRKTNLAAIVVYLNKEGTEKYSDKMMSDMKTVNEENAKQVMTQKQQDNWMNYPDVVSLWNEQYKHIKPLLAKDENRPQDLKDLVQFMAFTLTSGIFFPPRRSEWTTVKTRNYNPETDNYLDLKHNRFVLNQYKTAKNYGKAEVEFPKEFRAILLKYLKHCNSGDYLIHGAGGQPFTPTRLAQVLNRVFGKAISVSMLRHIYLSYKFADAPALKDITDTAAALGHGPMQSLEYVKRG